ncbi:MAG: redoxin domain-containing protein [Hyphomonas sp.]|uniref:TlpA family protein disulfide reductase n=1 Tax=Hyphomonas sp. TaxID=87 RepID=UPI00182CCF6C|nr:TlpA disulfide reductase family protein [Hyphomonas sp.]MBA3067654.1 redoxin domain-containing protein [Hyphomonas sp.]MBU3920249.1 redoxin family protein [Alphaproteobacteria bacterium]MBU4062260.1 redoxin family protein [Alphaproteobacteria bacterium]MBU4165695.1 redoxin family protein [Alphaproteobacteria bacterium]
MIKRMIPGLAALAWLAACGAPQTGEPAEAPAAGAAPVVEATAFLTGNASVPEGAADTEGDGVFRDAEGRPFTYALLGQKLPDFKAPLADGGVFDSAGLSQWTVIDIWGAWCSDCIADGPYVAALERAIAQDPHLDFISIHVPASAARATPEEMWGKYGSLEAYFETAGYRLPTALDLDGSLRETLKISWTPSYLLVSPDGAVRGFRTDLSVAGGEPVKDFLRDVARVKGEVRQAALLVIGPDGIGDLKQATPFTLRAVEAAFPGYNVIAATGAGSDAAAFEVRPKGSEDARFIVEPDWTRGYIARVSTRDAAVRGPAGETIGETPLGALSETARAACIAEPGKPGLLACPDPAAPAAFVRVYASGSDGAPDAAALLTELRYLPPTP